jgi:hypothetical protein
MCTFAKASAVVLVLPVVSFTLLACFIAASVKSTLKRAQLKESCRNLSGDCIVSAVAVF